MVLVHSSKWLPGNEVIEITNLPDECSRLTEILWLIDNGYEIKQAGKQSANGNGLKPTP